MNHNIIGLAGKRVALKITTDGFSVSDQEDKISSINIDGNWISIMFEESQRFLTIDNDMIEDVFVLGEELQINLSNGTKILFGSDLTY